MTLDDHTVSIRAEQAVIGALLRDNDALDRIGELDAAHFYRADHRAIFAEIHRQIGAGTRADALTVFERIGDKVDDCLPYLAKMSQSAVSAATIARHASIIVEKAIKRALAALGAEMQEVAASHDSAASCVDLMASKLDALAQKKTSGDPVRIDAMMDGYLTMIGQRAAGAVKPVPTGHEHLDELLGGGMERGTLVVVAGRPGMGKTAFALSIARNVAHSGSALYLSMEMAANQLNDRNVAALGNIPMGWLRAPTDEGDHDTIHWNSLTYAVTRTRDMNMFIDDQTGLNMLEIRAKARKVKRQHGLDMLLIDQLSFITGGIGDKSWEVIGQHTRALIALAKELNVVAVLLCQLNRECEKRADQRPIMSDLAASGAIEQDADTIIFLYRDDIARKLDGSERTGICEVNAAKQRQGDPGVIGLKYVGNQTRFEDLPYRWERKQEEPPQRAAGGFGQRRA